MKLPVTSVITSSRSGRQFVADLKKQRKRISEWAGKQLRSKNFVPGDTAVYKLAFISGDIFSHRERSAKNILRAARKHGYLQPPPNLAPDMWCQFSVKDLEKMDFFEMMVMHRPITGKDGHPDVFGFHRDEDGTWRLACFRANKTHYPPGICFVFIKP